MTAPASPSRLLLISCPGTRAQREGRFPDDEPLDEHARTALARVTWRPHLSQKVWVSPEIRAVEAAQALSLHAEVAAELRECDFGKWRGHSLEDILLEDAAGFSTWLGDVDAVPHGGESFDNQMTRVAAWLDEPRNGVVLTHGSVIRSAVVHALAAQTFSFLHIDIAPLTMTDLRFGNGKWRVRSVGVPLTAIPADMS